VTTTGIPADASALIYLAKAEAFALAAKCVGPLEVPPAVWREAAEAWEEIDAEEVGRMRVAEETGSLKRVTLSEKLKMRAGTLAYRHSMGAGEGEVLALATAGSHVMLDEHRATRVARKLGFVPIGTLRTPLIGAAQGHLSGPAAMELFHRLAEVSNARSDLVMRLEDLFRGSLR